VTYVLLRYPDLREGYRDLLDLVTRCGRKVSPRGQLTYEIPNLSFELTNPRDSVPFGIGRNLNYAILAAEAAMFIAGESHPELMKRIQPRFERYMDGGSNHGNYGVRTREALPMVIDSLTADRDTRQAQVVIWNNLQDLYLPAAKDLPCTTKIQFMIRDDKLEMFVSMRSNDAVMGLAYDSGVFTSVQLTIANIIDVEPGSYYHNAASFHVYERDLPLIDQMHGTLQYGQPDLLPLGFGDHGYTFADARDEAKAALRGDGDNWYAQQIGKYT
jgi:thymidylate synthase